MHQKRTQLEPMTLVRGKWSNIKDEDEKITKEELVTLTTFFQQLFFIIVVFHPLLCHGCLL